MKLDEARWGFDLGIFREGIERDSMLLDVGFSTGSGPAALHNPFQGCKLNLFILGAHLVGMG